MRERFIQPARERTRELLGDAGGDELATAVNALVNGLLLERLFDPEGVPDDLVTRALDALVSR